MRTYLITWVNGDEYKNIQRVLIIEYSNIAKFTSLLRTPLEQVSKQFWYEFAFLSITRTASNAPFDGLSIQQPGR